MKHLLPHLSYLDDQHEPMVDLVIRLCNQNSGTLNLAGLAETRNILVDQYGKLGGQLSLVDVPNFQLVRDSGEQVSQPLGKLIHIVKRPDQRPRVALCIHMDTVFAADDPFQECRFLDKSTLNGPGVADAKGGLVVMLWALKTLEASPLASSLGWEVIINADEELGSPGSTGFLKSRAQTADIGMLFEPTMRDGTLVSWRKGAGNFDIVVRGRSAHAGREFSSGRNAIVALAKIIAEIDTWNTNPEVTLNAGQIAGGRAINMVPDSAVGRLNIRVKSDDQRQGVQQKLDDLIARYNQLDGIAVQLFGEFRSAPKILDQPTMKLQRRVEDCGQALGIEVKWKETGGTCDGNKFASAGLPNIDTFGPQGGNIHSSDEFLLVESLIPRTKLAALLLLSVADQMS